MTITPFVAAKKITTEKRTTTTIPINSRKQYLWCFAERLHCDIVCADWHIEKYAFNPNKKDTLSVQATESGKIANTTYTCYRTYNGYGVTIVADTIWDGSSLNHKEYIFPFSQSQYTVKEIPFIMSSGEKATIYEVLDKKGNIAGQYVMFNKDATNYLLYLIPYTQVEQTKEERQGSAIKKLLNDLIIDM